MNPSGLGQTNNSQYIPRQQKQQLDAAYQGRCILTLARVAIQCAHILPFAHGTRMFSFLLSRKLRVSISDDEYASQAAVNLIPLQVTFHILFDQGMWTLFPTMDALEECIIFEEAWIAYRRASINSLGHDPGRPDYYFHDKNQYEIHQNSSIDPLDVIRLDIDTNTRILYFRHRDFPGSRPQRRNSDFPVLDLIASLPFVVYGRLPHFLSMASQSIYQQNLRHAAVYLIALWAWGPQHELPVNRPPWLRVLSSEHDGCIVMPPIFPPTPTEKGFLVPHSHVSRFGRQEDNVEPHLVSRPSDILTPPETPVFRPSLWISHSNNDTSDLNPLPQTVAVELTQSPSLPGFTRGMRTCSRSFAFSTTEDAQEVDAEQESIVPVGLDDNLERVRLYMACLD